MQFCNRKSANVRQPLSYFAQALLLCSYRKYPYLLQQKSLGGAGVLKANIYKGK